MKTLFLCILLFFLGCTKPEPQPELSDPIYQDLNTQLGNTRKSLAEAQKALEENRVSFDKATPQTGQIKFAQKRVFDAQRMVDQLLQEEKYWKLRIDDRLRVAREKYLTRWKKKEPWPDAQEFKDYSAEKRLRQAKQQWDARERIEDFNRSLKNEKKSAHAEGEGGAKSEHE